ncbi:MAG: SAM-dependent chlorinase/fluorinase [bacterium]|nr:MAG: SAM-dependent chlorinase/fluorinase [bacterium]
MKPNGIITLLTDFGTTDGFVGTMKGIILSINPEAKIVDISHEIAAHDIEAGAFLLNNCYRYFPKGTIHVAIVDPGVGSERKILAVESDNYFFITPDNQILKYIFHSNETLTVVEVLNKRFFLDSVSHTFHGRDIFAPVAAHLSKGVAINQFGHEITNYDAGEIDEPIITESGIIGKIIYIDKFGNLITNITEDLISKQISLIKIGTTTINRLSDSYAEVYTGHPLAIIGSSGYMEIAVRNGNARKQLYLDRGEIITIEF